MINKRSAEIVETLQLNPHPEGGYFKELYKAEEEINQSSLPPRYKSGRSFSTSIYFFLSKEDISKFHKIKSDETWHFYEGSPLELIVIDPNGKLQKRILGLDFKNGERPQLTIPKEHWFGARTLGEYTLMGCTVAPGFEFEDFELANRDDLINQFPSHKAIIEKYT